MTTDAPQGVPKWARPQQRLTSPSAFQRYTTFDITDLALSGESTDVSEPIEVRFSVTFTGLPSRSEWPPQTHNQPGIPNSLRCVKAPEHASPNCPQARSNLCK